MGFKKSVILVLIGFLFAASPARAINNECQVPWLLQLATDGATPKPFLDDLSAGYAEVIFLREPGTRLQMRGSFANARFESIEEYDFSTAVESTPADYIFDYQIKPLPGSTNPFLPGAKVDALLRNFVVEVGASFGAANTVNAGKNIMQVLVVRIYSPNENVTLTAADIPRVYSYDALTNQPAPCPKFIRIPEVNFPFKSTVDESGQLHFAEPSDSTTTGAQNHAIPQYLGTNNSMKLDDVAVIRFKAPTFVNTHSGTGVYPSGKQVRYWSMCGADMTKGLTFGCVPDYKSKIDSNGYVTIVVSSNEKVRSMAASQGYDFILDKRASGATTASFIYRNMLPEAGFQANSMYKGEYLPGGRICSSAEYLAGGCKLTSK